jgi:hypothetical protein
MWNGFSKSEWLCCYATRRVLTCHDYSHEVKEFDHLQSTTSAEEPLGCCSFSRGRNFQTDSLALTEMKYEYCSFASTGDNTMLIGFYLHLQASIVPNYAGLLRLLLLLTGAKLAWLLLFGAQYQCGKPCFPSENQAHIVDFSMLTHPYSLFIYNLCTR